MTFYNRIYVFVLTSLTSIYANLEIIYQRIQAEMLPNYCPLLVIHTQLLIQDNKYSVGNDGKLSLARHAFTNLANTENLLDARCCSSQRDYSDKFSNIPGKGGRDKGKSF